MPSLGSPSRCVLLFARTPSAEARHKRAPAAQALYALACDRIVRAAEALGVDLVVAGSAGPRNAQRRIPQRGSNFGERLTAAFQDARALGYAHVVAVGIDTPALDVSHVSAAFAALEHHDRVVGPSEDGGAYLIGARTEVSGWWSGIRWQTPHAGRDLLRRAPSAVLLPTLSDVDDARAIGRLARAPSLDPVLRRVLSVLLFPARPRPSLPMVRRAEARCETPAIRGPPSAI